VVVEALVGLVVAFFEILPVIIEALVYVVAASVTIVAYLLSPSFRHKKQKEWAAKPVKKYLDLGISGLCMVTLLALVAWFFWPKPASTPNPDTVRVEPGQAEEDLRVTVKEDPVAGTNSTTFAIKKGGLQEIMKTESLAELAKALSNNVTVVAPGTNRGGPPTILRFSSTRTNTSAPPGNSNER
jgi:hypothetical protein